MIIKDKEDKPKKELIPKKQWYLYSSSQTGYIGETYVLYKLAQYKMPAIVCPASFDYDILTANNLRLEVKTGRLQKKIRRNKDKTNETYTWGFANHSNKIAGAHYKNNKTYIMYSQIERNRDCDFFVFVCMDKKYKIVRTYVVPKAIIGKRKLIIIPFKGGGILNEYYDKWELIVGDLTDGV